MEPIALIVVGAVVVALAFDIINGFHDAANSIATVVSTRVSLFDFIAERAELEAGTAELFALITGGGLKLHIGQTYPLADVARAHRDLEARRTTGSTLLLP